MLHTFRKYAREIIMVTVVLFVVSLFSLGAFSWFSKYKNGPDKKESSKISSVATVDGVPIDEGRFYRQFNQMFASIPEAQRMLIDPDILDYYRYDALQKTVSFMLMLKEAKKQGINALPQETNYRVEQIAKIYQLKNVGQLRKILKERKIAWRSFKNEQKEEIMVAKTVNGISGRVSVTPLDRKMAFTEVKARHILIKVETDNVQEDVKALKKAEQVYETVLANRGAFAEYARKFSEDKLTAENGGDLGWIGRGQMVPEFEKQLYKMQPGDIVGPVKTMFGYHIIQVLDRKEKPMPAGLSEQDLDNQILQDKQAEAVRKWIKPIQDSANVVLVDSSLKAYEARIKRDYLGALIEYQKMLSSQPQNLLLYIQIARMYDKLNRPEESNSIYQRAMIWQKYNPQYQYPILYFSAIEHFNKAGKKNQAQGYVSDVVKYFGNNLAIMTAVSNNYQQLLTKDTRTDYTKKLEALLVKEREKAKQEMAQQALQNMPKSMPEKPSSTPATGPRR